MPPKAPIKLFSGTNTRYLAEKISLCNGRELGKVNFTKFSDGEFTTAFEETIRGSHVFLIQSTFPPSDNLFELLMMIDAAKRASAYKLVAVIPYFGFARQDRKDKPRVAIGSKLVADLLTTAGVDRIITMDLHADQIPGFFNIPVDHLYASSVFVSYIKEMNLDNLVMAAPDMGGTKRANAYANHFGTPLVICHKARKKANEIGDMKVIGEVEGKNVILLDDIIDTAGTITAAAEVLKEKGAKDVYACGTHALFSGPAIERLKNAPITKIIVTNTIAQKEHNLDNLEVLSIAPLVGEAIDRIFKDLSVSVLF